MGNKQSIQGSAPGIDVDGAIENAFTLAQGPGAGFDFQTLVVHKIAVQRGGFVPETKTLVYVTIFDGTPDSDELVAS